MDITIPTYLNKEFTIDDNRAVIRNPKRLDNTIKYKAVDNIPPGSFAGDTKVIPLNTRVKVTDVMTDKRRNVYVYAVPIDAPDFVPFGWTKYINLTGNFLNEIIGYSPKEWDLAPQGDNHTVVDKMALIREGAPRYRSIRQAIPVGTYVDITARTGERNRDGKYVRVRHMTIEDGQIIAGEPIGWTVADNLIAGCATVFSTSAWADKKSDNAAWKLGKFIGAKVLVGIVGRGGQLQHIVLETLESYLQLMEAAKEDNLTLSINSGFRTFAKQKMLFDGWKARRPGFNRAAVAGRSNHQNGIAFDLNTGGFDGSPVYDWLKKNATKYGFIRTVNGEHWHWEYRPEEAVVMRKRGEFKLSRVRR